WLAGRYQADQERVDRAVAAVLPLAPAAARAAQAFGSALALLGRMAQPHREAVVVGSASEAPVSAALRAVRDISTAGDMLLLLDPASDVDGRHALQDLAIAEGRYPATDPALTVYVCRGGVCRLPVHDADAVRHA